jgi:hypothetical protein
MIYFILDQTHQAIKIGFTQNLKQRIRGLQWGTLSKLILLGSMEGDRRTEERLHVRFAGLHISGEWFRETPELRVFLAQACAGGEETNDISDQPAKDGYWTVEQLQYHIPIDVATMLDWIENGGLPHCRFGPLLYFPPTAVHEWLRERTVLPESCGT